MDWRVIRGGKGVVRGGRDRVMEWGEAGAIVDCVESASQGANVMALCWGEGRDEGRGEGRGDGAASGTVGRRRGGYVGRGAGATDAPPLSSLNA